MKKYKVLHITNGADVGGISNVILNYYRNIDREQFQFDLVIPPDTFGPNGRELENLGASFYTLPRKGEHPIAFINGIRKLIKNNKYDAIHVHHHSSCYFPLFIALLCGVKCRVAQCHSYMVNESFLTRIKRYIGIILNDLTSNLRFACTEEAANHLFGKSRRLFPVTILPNGVEPEKFSFSEQTRSEAREELNIGGSELVFGIVGRMTPEKNHKYLIDVLSEMLKIRKDVKLLLVGDGPIRKELIEYAEHKGVSDNAIFAGRRPDLVNMLCAMDVFTMPSIYEGSPVSAVEAYANGLPVVLSSSITKGLRFFSNVVYIDIDSKSCELWAKAIIEFAKRGRDINAVSIINQNGYNVRGVAYLLANSYLDKL